SAMNSSRLAWASGISASAFGISVGASPRSNPAKASSELCGAEPALAAATDAEFAGSPPSDARKSSTEVGSPALTGGRSRRSGVPARPVVAPASHAGTWLVELPKAGQPLNGCSVEVGSVAGDSSEPVSPSAETASCGDDQRETTEAVEVVSKGERAEVG